MMMMIARTRFAMLLVAIVALWGLTGPLAAAGTVTPFSYRFQQQQQKAATASGDTLHASFAVGLTTVFSTADVSTWPNLPEVKHWKSLYEASGAVPAAVDAAEGAWIAHLRTQFPAAQRKSHPRVLVRGGGPSGLFAALYARKHAETVHVRQDRSRYTRQHVVSTWAATTFPCPTGEDKTASVSIDGAEQFIVGELGLQHGRAADAVTTAFAAALEWKAAPANRRFIMVSDLEKLLALAANVVGVKIEFGATTGAAHANRGTPRAASNSLAAAGAQGPFALVKKCDAFTQAKAAANLFPAKYDVLVGAEGTNSPTRGHYMDAVFETPLMYTSKKKIPTGVAGVAVAVPAVSSVLKNTGGLVTAGFVYVGLDGGQSLCTGGKQVTAKTGSMSRKPFFKKWDTGCQVEIFFNVPQGARLRRAFGGGCGYNYNMFSASAPKPEDTKRLALMRAILDIGTKGNAASPNAQQTAFDHVTEFKLWENTLRMSMARSDSGTVRPSALVGVVNGDNSAVVLVGDSVRDAMPDGGMGVNDGHHQAKQFGEAVRVAAADYDAFQVKSYTGTDKNAKAAATFNRAQERLRRKTIADAMAAHLALMAAHETKVVRALHVKMGSEQQGEPYLELDNSAGGNALTNHLDYATGPQRFDYH